MNPNKPIALRTFVAVLLSAALFLSIANAQSREQRLANLASVVQLVAFDAAGEPYMGSGTILTASGLILTNYHVVETALDTTPALVGVMINDPENPQAAPELAYLAQYVSGDANLDLAVLKITASVSEENGTYDVTELPADFSAPHARLGSIREVLQGDEVRVIGFPGISGDTVTVTGGIISGFVGEDLISGGNRWVKTDAKISYGNSGGGAFDRSGRLVGVPTSRLDDVFTDGTFEMQAFLRPVDLALPLLRPFAAEFEPALNATDVTVDETSARQNLLEQFKAFSNQLAAAPQDISTPLDGAVTEIMLNQTGRLTASDEVLDDEYYVDSYVLELEENQTYRVTLESDSIDPYLIITRSDTSTAHEYDDTEGLGMNVQEVFTPTESGRHGFFATSYGPFETGSYQLKVERVVGASTASLAIAELQSELTRNDIELDSGSFAKSYAFEARAGDDIMFDLTAQMFTPALIIFNAETEDEVYNSFTTGRAFGSVTIAEDGLYILGITSFESNATGPFDFAYSGFTLEEVPATP